MSSRQNLQQSPTKYRSAQRDAPRRILARDLPGQEPYAWPTRPGVVEYARNGLTLSRAIEGGRSHHRGFVVADLVVERDRLIQALDDLHIVASQFIPLEWLEPYANVNEVHRLLTPCFHKSLLSLYVAQSLTFEGLYGPARPLMRQAFEFLVIGKFCSVHPTSEVFDKWIDQMDVYLASAVLKRVAKPELTEISQLWSRLSKWTHSTSESVQINVSLADSREDIELNAGLIGVLIRFADHLLRSHIATPSLKYYGRRYRRSPRTVSAEDNLRKFFAWHAEVYTVTSRKLIQEYRSKWVLR